MTNTTRTVTERALRGFQGAAGLAARRALADLNATIAASARRNLRDVQLRLAADLSGAAERTVWTHLRPDRFTLPNEHPHPSGD